MLDQTINLTSVSYPEGSTIVAVDAFIDHFSEELHYAFAVKEVTHLHD